MHLTERRWLNLTRNLRQQRCVLFLGDRLISRSDADATPVSDLLSLHLAEVLKEEGISFQQAAVANLPYVAQRFLSVPKMRRLDLEDEVLEFYKQTSVSIPDIYRQLAQLPFSLIISTTPDDCMYRALLASGKTHTHQLYYNFKRERNPVITEISAEKPLVYNLLGDLADPESLVISQDDRVDFIKSVVRSNPGIPNAIMGCFDERKTYIFLGFDLEQWDVRLMLDSLQLTKENLTVSPQGDNHPLSTETKSYLEDRFHFLFVEEEMKPFAKELSRRFEQDDAPTTTRVAHKRRVVILFDNNEADNECCQNLINHLSPWVNEGRVTLWHPGMVPYGENTRDTTLRSIQEADAVIPVLSVDYISNAVEQHLFILQEMQQRPLFILPVLHRACDWADTPFANFPILPERGKPIKSWPDADAVYTHIAMHIKTMLTHG